MRQLRFVTLEEIKNNARIETNDEDKLITRIGLSAEDTVLNLMERTIEDILEEFNDKIPEPICHATLMLATHYCLHRTPFETIPLHAVPYTIDVMLKPYIRL